MGENGKRCVACSETGNARHALTILNIFTKRPATRACEYIRSVVVMYRSVTLHISVNTGIGSTCHDWLVIRVPKSACLPDWNWQYLS